MTKMVNKTTINITSLDDLIEGVDNSIKSVKNTGANPFEIVQYWEDFMKRYNVKKDIAYSVMDYVWKEAYKDKKIK